MTVKVRIAPSPTGSLHIGTARTALFNWLFARRHGGEFILRIEDTDLERSKREYEQNIIEGLQWLGLDWDNERIIRQTERLPIYRKYLERLLAEGKAFERTFTDEEKVAMIADGKTPRDTIIALKMPEAGEQVITFEDRIRGRISVAAKDVGFVSLAKDLDTPLYNFAVVVDDLDMQITHVIRGEDHISNTPKQLLIYKALGATPPEFTHLPLILGPDRSKMSKRHGATNIVEYQQDYLPDALINFMGFLGYTYDQEMLTKEEMAQQFDIGNVHKSGAVFDQKKLNWYNSQYMKRLSPKAFKELIGRSELPDAVVPIMTERLERLTDAAQFSYLWEAPQYEREILQWKTDGLDGAARALRACMDLSERESMTQEALDTLVTEQFGGQKGSVYWPLRVALSGQKNSAGPLDIIAVIGIAQARDRIATALQKLQ